MWLSLSSLSCISTTLCGPAHWHCQILLPVSRSPVGCPCIRFHCGNFKCRYHAYQVPEHEREIASPADGLASLSSPHFDPTGRQGGRRTSAPGESVPHDSPPALAQPVAFPGFYFIANFNCRVGITVWKCVCRACCHFERKRRDVTVVSGPRTHQCLCPPSFFGTLLRAGSQFIQTSRQPAETGDFCDNRG